MMAVIGAAGPVLRALGANWQYVLIAALLVWAGIERMGRQDCQLGRARAIAEAQQRADSISAELLIEQQKKAAVIETKVTEYVDRIRTVQVAKECPVDERDKLGTRGVRDILGKPKAKRGPDG
jgi:hypothetical protein